MTIKTIGNNNKSPESTCKREKKYSNRHIHRTEIMRKAPNSHEYHKYAECDNCKR